ncbi:MAG TPA: selenoneine biosynthesis selenosugar synthase SenB [Pyrinomonadaceae bacterium]|nr:selenoneine biosynthesis selenosugar synthase SenB [Pyrinomonadaceae bacterium]
MRIAIVTPAPPDSRHGNRITALRWTRIFRRLGNTVSILQTYDGEPYDLLVALHARKSYPSIINFRDQNPAAPVVVALTGTDLYRDIRTNHRAQESLDMATRIVVLQPKAIEELRPSWRKKTRVIYQSFEDKQAPTGARGSSAKTRATKAEARANRNFDVCVIGHLRTVKDPFRTAMAARSLPDSSRIRVLQIGGAMTAAMANRARKESSANQRYRWLGEQPRSRALRILKQSSLCVLSSRMEGGANVLSEAIASSVPILASRIDGNVGILGADYPGYFDFGNTTQLARLLTRAETSPGYLAELKAWSEGLAVLADPAREEQAWSDLFSELFGRRSGIEETRLLQVVDAGQVDQIIGALK